MDFKIGQSFSFNLELSNANLDDYSQLTGDKNHLHMDEAFAQSYNYKTRVVHGAFLLGFISRMIGMHLPGGDCLLQTINAKFISPAYADDKLEFCAIVDQISEAVNVIVIKFSIKNITTGNVLAQGKAQVGLLK